MDQWSAYVQSISQSFYVIDVGGQRTERRKWMHYWDKLSTMYDL